MNILHVKSIKLTHALCIRRSFWRFLPFKTRERVRKKKSACTLLKNNETNLARTVTTMFSSQFIIKRKVLFTVIDD